MLVLMFSCTTESITKGEEKMLDDNYTKILDTVSNKSWKQHPTNQRLYGHLSPILQIIQVRQQELILQLCADSGCSQGGLPGDIINRDGWCESLSVEAEAFFMVHLIVSAGIFRGERSWLMVRRQTSRSLARFDLR